jgi:hypothetical protein
MSESHNCSKTLLFPSIAKSEEKSLHFLHPASRRVNNPWNDGLKLLKPVVEG